MFVRSLPLLAFLTLLVPASAANAAAIAFPPAIGGFEYQACFEKLPNTGVIAGEGIYVNSYVANGQASNMTMGSRPDNYHCLVGDPRHYGNVHFTVNFFTFAGGALGPQIASYEVVMQTLLPKFIVEGPSVGRVGVPFATWAPIYTDPSSSLPWSASVVAGSLPPGLRVIGNGRINGVPRAAGTFSFVLEYTTAIVPWREPARPRYRVALVIAKPLAVLPDTLPAAIVGRRYRARLAGARGAPPYSFKRIKGSLPRGLTLSPTGTIAGTPRRAGTYKIVVAVTDDLGDHGRDTVVVRVRPRR
jgi:large repetitive protein